MAPVYEICIFPVTPGTFESGKAKEDNLAGLKLILEQPGCTRVLAGPGIEDPKKYLWVVNWESLEAHETFMGKDNYKPFVASLGKHFTPGVKPDVFHISLPEGPLPNPPKGSAVGVSQFIVKAGKLDASVSLFKELDDAAKSQTKVQGPYGAVTGVAIDKENVIVAVTSWDSPEQHATFGKEVAAPYLQRFTPLLDNRDILHIQATLYE